MAGPRFTLARPVGGALTALGVAGLLLASLPGSLPVGGSAGAPAASDREFQAVGAPSGDTVGDTTVDPQAAGAPGGAPAPEASVAQVPAGPDKNDGRHVVAPSPEPPADAADTADAAVAARTPDSALVILSGSFLIIGVGLAGLRWMAKRLGDG